MLALMQPSNALLPVTSYPKTVGGMCYAIIELILIGLKQPLVTSQSQAGKLDTLYQHASVDKLSQHAVAQSQAREARHTIPACKVQTSYPSMQVPNHRPGKLDTLSQHAVN